MKKVEELLGEESVSADRISISDDVDLFVSKLKGKSWFEKEEECRALLYPDVSAVAENCLFDTTITRLMLVGAIPQQTKELVVSSLQKAISQTLDFHSKQTKSMITGGIVVIYETQQQDNDYEDYSSELCCATGDTIFIFSFIEGPPTYLHDILKQINTLFASNNSFMRVILNSEDCPAREFTHPIAIYLSASPTITDTHFNNMGTGSWLNRTSDGATTSHHSAEDITMLLLSSLCQEVNHFPSKDCSGIHQEECENIANNRNNVQKEETFSENLVNSTDESYSSVPTSLSQLPVMELSDIRHREAVPTAKWMKSFFDAKSSPKNESGGVEETKSFLLCYPSLSEYLSIYAEPYLAVELESECTFPPYSVLDMIDYDDLRQKLSEN